MLNIGPGELVAIAVIALIVLGPEKLPQALRTLGRITAELRRVSGGFQNELRNALEEQSEPVKRQPDRPKPPTGASGDRPSGRQDGDPGDPGSGTSDGGTGPGPEGTADTMPDTTLTTTDAPGPSDAPDNPDRS
jgi:sec-independent protein translocase protein TatB